MKSPEGQNQSTSVRKHRDLTRSVHGAFATAGDVPERAHLQRLMFHVRLFVAYRIRLMCRARRSGNLDRMPHMGLKAGRLPRELILSSRFFFQNILTTRPRETALKGRSHAGARLGLRRHACRSPTGRRAGALIGILIVSGVLIGGAGTAAVLRQRPSRREQKD